MEIVNMVKFNDRFVVKEYREQYKSGADEWAEIYDLKNKVMVGLYSNGSVVYRDIQEGEIERDVKNIKISDVAFKTLTGHKVVIVKDKSLLINYGEKARELKKVIDVITKENGEEKLKNEREEMGMER
ncbi:hypothetical protein ABOONEI_2270 [Aciduliprofundum boonei T469]|nr:hypothetical protein ABOONEI_2270 [Aciduliprofundum boonei T469]